MKMPAKFIKTVSVIDPDTIKLVKVDLYKLATGEIVGLNRSWLGQRAGVSLHFTIPAPPLGTVNRYCLALFHFL